MGTKLAKIAEIAKAKPKERFTSLAHLMNEELLIQCHRELKSKRAAGIDNVTKEAYESGLADNTSRLHQLLKTMTYKPQAVKRTYIPKTGSTKKRPLGIPAYEDKIVQLALSKILTAIYEQDFVDTSFGFRPGKNCHDALRKLHTTIMSEKMNWVVDADIEGFFDNVNHEWMRKALEVRIKDPQIIRLVMRILKAGIMEQGVMKPSLMGTPQGGVISPLLANIYLHYVLDLWFEQIVKKSCKGSAHMIRYADDFICCFQYRQEAYRFFETLEKRLAKFGLKLSVEKTRVIEFGMFAAQNRKAKGEGKPETFDFLGFTHYCGLSRNGKSRVKRRTSKKKLDGASARIKEWLKRARCLSVKEIMAGLNLRLAGHFRYYGVTDNSPGISSFLHIVTGLLFKWLNRRSQRNSYTWESFKKLLTVYPLQKAMVYVSVTR